MSDTPPEGGTRKLPVVESPPGPGEPQEGLDRSASSGPPTPAPGDEVKDRRERRFWSERRVPAALVAAVVLAGAGLLLYDIVSVRAGRSATRLRRSLTDELATRPLDDVWVLAGASVATALGIWLLVLAVTPGLRGLLPMRRNRSDVRAALARAAAELMLRDRAMEVPGVRSVRVVVGRRKVKVRALSHFRDPDDVHADLDAVFADALPDLGLAREPGLSVRVRRANRKG
ncbi:DUF6286 domain-containing protein [Streptomyces sp. GC420]|uniref:DUF6286 domain-containing protein n=1 Tax=Streptomyces sp. GC420 TaxID=2697568 RepID=UPI001414FF60|nr:DUF6286 domain-containing protein [Streptomyces sp. GC420]NBM14797.1 hypothetical protein [Streptomyces sp. GC420]